MDKSECELYWWSTTFSNKVASYSDVSCQTFNDGNNSTHVVISGPQGTDLINLNDCINGENCNVTEIANGKGGGARFEK